MHTQIRYNELNNHLNFVAQLIQNLNCIVRHIHTCMLMHTYNVYLQYTNSIAQYSECTTCYDSKKKETVLSIATIAYELISAKLDPVCEATDTLCICFHMWCIYVVAFCFVY